MTKMLRLLTLALLGHQRRGGAVVGVGAGVQHIRVVGRREAGVGGVDDELGLVGAPSLVELKSPIAGGGGQAGQLDAHRWWPPAAFCACR